MPFLQCILSNELTTTLQIQKLAIKVIIKLVDLPFHFQKVDPLRLPYSVKLVLFTKSFCSVESRFKRVLQCQKAGCYSQFWNPSLD